MKRITESQYQAAPNETVQLQINPVGVSHLPSVVHDHVVLQPVSPGLYEFKITKPAGSVEFVVVTATFLTTDPPTAEYPIIVQDTAGSSWNDRVIKHSDPPITWQTVIRFMIV
jgi:hypothetical protein